MNVLATGKQLLRFQGPIPVAEHHVNAVGASRHDVQIAVAVQVGELYILRRVKGRVERS
jgi:hypothetical protein